MAYQEYLKVYAPYAQQKAEADWRKQEAEHQKNQDYWTGIRADTAATNADTSAKRAATYEEATENRAKADEKRQELNEKREDENERHHSALEYINTNKQLTEAQKDAIRGKETERYHKAIEAIQAQRADTYEQGTSGRLLQGEEGLGIKKQNADTASDRAGTYKYGVMEGTKIKQQNADTNAKREGATEILNAAKIKKMENSVTAENKKPFQAARDTYNRAAALYQSLTRPGVIAGQASQTDIDAAKTKMDTAQATMEKLAGGGASPAAPAIDPKQLTPENLEFTAKKYGITVDEVKKRLGVQ